MDNTDTKITIELRCGLNSVYLIEARLTVPTCMHKPI